MSKPKLPTNEKKWVLGCTQLTAEYALYPNSMAIKESWSCTSWPNKTLTGLVSIHTAG